MLGATDALGEVPSSLCGIGETEVVHAVGVRAALFFELDAVGAARGAAEFLEGVVRGGLAVLVVPGEVAGLAAVDV